MPSNKDLIKHLTTLNKIAETLNQSVDVHSALDLGSGPAVGVDGTKNRLGFSG